MDNSNNLLPLGLTNLSIDRHKETAAPNGSLEQEQFLELMLTQLKNQDPLKPMESGDFLGQIAQFGTVTGISELQQSFTSLAASLQSSQALQASTMVGRNVLIESDKVQFDGQSERRMAFELPTSASEVQLNIQDATGQVVRQVSFGARDHGLVDFAWDGADSNGKPLAPGSYSITAEAIIDGVNQAVPTFIQTRVESVTLARNGQPPALNLAEIGAVDIGSVKRVL
ncbi:MAG: flagellar basal-body rod modification protein FlgD [Gammaproteobacteria bacterium]|jgi:flagellar basal-body rod modification protein FlgD